MGWKFLPFFSSTSTKIAHGDGDGDGNNYNHRQHDGKNDHWPAWRTLTQQPARQWTRNQFIGALFKHSFSFSLIM